MKKVALILADGFEEIEAITPIDVLRRAGFTCEILGLTSRSVRGSHDIVIQADSLFMGDLSGYDAVVLPGGMPGTQHLRAHDGLIAALQEAEGQGLLLAAICAAPLVLDRAGLLENRRFTCYPGQIEHIQSGVYCPEDVVQDGLIVTSRGAGTSLAFAYRLVECLGGDAEQLAKSMVYTE